MAKLLLLTGREFYIQYKVNNLIKYLVAFFLFYCLSISLISNHEEIKKFGMIFSVIYLPISLINFSSFILKEDIKDGTLEQMLMSFTSLQIALAKFLSLIFCSFCSITITLPIIYVIFDISAQLWLHLVYASVFLVVLSCALLILISAVEAYFRSNTNYLSLLIMPILIPSIIMTGLIIQDEINFSIIFIIFGISLIMVPICLSLSSYLIKNIYNI